MKPVNIKFLSPLLVLGILTLSACFDDLNTIPIDEDIVTSAQVYDDPTAYKAVLAKLYAGLAVSGQEGPSGQSDIAGIDEGFGQYLRGYWYHQEFPTEEAVVGWNDQTIKDFHEQDWNAQDGFINAFYSRVFYQISLTNEFLRETTPERLAGRNVDSDLEAQIDIFRAEARFLRALSYWHALDLFRNIPFVTEEDLVGSFFPEQNSPQATFDYIESELKAIESTLIAPQQNEYGRADMAAAWALLAKLYLNAEVYIGQARYSECIEYCDKIINAGFSLEPEYQNLFLADNDRSNEIIFPVTFDGLNTRTWGGMTFIIRAGIGGDMIPGDFGVESGWSGTRTTSGLVDKFATQEATTIDVVSANFVEPDYPVIYVPGEYQNWDPTNASTVLWETSGDGNFVGYFNFLRRTEILFTPQPNLNSSFGDNDGDGQLDPNGGNIPIDAGGFYRIEVNVNNFTYSITPFSWGIAGSATNASDTTELSYNAAEEYFEYTGNFVPGELQFVSLDGSISLGDNGSQILETGGNNISFNESGNFTVRLYVNRPDFTYSIVRPSSDSRQLFFTEGQSLDIFDISQFQEGYAVVKFQNKTSNGQNGSDMAFPDTDFPMFRLGDIYLMYAESVLRGGGGDRGTALDLVNQIRTRAFRDPSGGISDGELDLDFLLDERARELYWECHRRTDLVRYGRFSNTDYTWPWKGGTPEGRSVDAKFDIYPIPSSDIGSNPNLVQNSGY